MKKFLSALLAKETLIKIIFVQVIVLLFMAMTNGGITVFHRGFLDLGSQYGGLELKIQK
ncbi:MULTISPECIES: hypothetical protein [Pseudomonas]|uniref:hypothetical protein n=1 Tax=Pseudomonas TaxID=286 RepID=UPI001B213474|nr:hypothetical protein [Pseudomonas sp. V3/3/4/13]MBO6278326.1 hypothetical protein [Pseudomonas sp.]MBP3935417.1 hypothetical protein [Pseudomonas sp.]